MITPSLTLRWDLQSQRFAYWDYHAETRELVHRRSGTRIPLEAALSSPNEMLRCIFRTHDQAWGDAKTLDELVELLGTYFKGERLLQSDV
jgi:hypothetical protein